MSKPVSIAAVAAVAVFGLAWYAFYAGPPRRASSPTLPTKATSQPQEVTPTKFAQVRTPPLAPLIPPSPPAASAMNPSDSAEELEGPLRVSANLEDYRDYLDLYFGQTGRDRVWEATAEPRLRTNLTRLESPAVRLESLECRADLCKAIMSGDNDETLLQTKSGIVRGHFWAGPMVLVSTEPTSPTDFRFVAFFGREGRELPDS